MSRSLIKRLCFDRSGVAALEFAFVAPVVILLFVGSITLFDMYRAYQNIVEANGIVADVVSRQTTVNDAFIANLYGVFTNLQTDKTAPNALRVSSITKTGGVYKLAWKKESGKTTLLKPQVLDTTKLPDISDGDSIIYVEGTTDYSVATPLLGFGTINYAESAFTRPRFIGAVAYN
jgi:Flp pilus assembly protein TadG